VIASPDVASKRWIWEQYDRHVMADTLEDSATGADAGIVRVHGSGKAIAVTSDCTPRYVAADPFEGGKQAVAEAWRNLTAVGADPIAVTDNLNFGNPERPEIMGQLVRAIDGMSEACRILAFPVVSGNVSLYNETEGVAIPPTPTVGAVGLLADGHARASFDSMAPGDTLLVVGVSRGELGSSLYLREVLGREEGAPPPVDLQAERRNGDFVRGLIASGRLRTVHDLSDGGLVIAAAEMALASNLGLELDLTSAAHAHVFLFCEDQGRYLVATDQPEAIIAAALVVGINIAEVGVAGGEDFASRGLFSLPLARLREAHEAWLPAYMAGV
jgi:phosphoribosylformylglycinamidine synthase